MCALSTTAPAPAPCGKRRGRSARNGAATPTNAMLTALKKLPEFDWLNEVSSVPLQQARRHLDTAYRNFFQRRARYPQFRRKDGPQSAEFTKSAFSYRNEMLKLAKMTEPLKVVWSRKLPSDREQRRLSRKQKGSTNRAKARIKVARAYAAVHHARRDFLHRLSTRLIRENQTVYVENLSVKGLLKAKRCGKFIADAGWGELVRMLTYKAAWYGRKLVKIDRFFPSTKTYSACGTTGHVLTLDDRGRTCPDCGAHHDRDFNAARNILFAGLAVSACGEDVSLGVLRHSGQSSVKQEPAS